MKKTIQCLLLGVGILQLQPLTSEAQSKKGSAASAKWPAGTSPQEVGKRVAEHFVATPHTNFGRSTPPKVITYPETCTWYGALTFAKQTGDKELTQKLAQRFEPLFGS